jgi:hypothetical protein
MAEPATEHIAFVDSGHFERLHGGNRESKEADRQSIRCQGVRHNHLGKKLALILHPKACGSFTNLVLAASPRMAHTCRCLACVRSVNPEPETGKSKRAAQDDED